MSAYFIFFQPKLFREKINQAVKISQLKSQDCKAVATRAIRPIMLRIRSLSLLLLSLLLSVYCVRCCCRYLASVLVFILVGIGFLLLLVVLLLLLLFMLFCDQFLFCFLQGGFVLVFVIFIDDFCSLILFFGDRVILVIHIYIFFFFSFLFIFLFFSSFFAMFSLLFYKYGDFICYFSWYLRFRHCYFPHFYFLHCDLVILFIKLFACVCVDKTEM